MTDIIATIIGIIITTIGAIYIINKQQATASATTTQFINNIQSSELLADQKIKDQHNVDITRATQVNPIDLLTELYTQLHARHSG